SGRGGVETGNAQNARVGCQLRDVHTDTRPVEHLGNLAIAGGDDDVTVTVIGGVETANTHHARDGCQLRDVHTDTRPVEHLGNLANPRSDDDVNAHVLRGAGNAK